jgi:hypothetical protein
MNEIDHDFNLDMCLSLSAYLLPTVYAQLRRGVALALTRGQRETRLRVCAGACVGGEDGSEARKAVWDGYMEVGCSD